MAEPHNYGGPQVDHGVLDDTQSLGDTILSGGETILSGDESVPDIQLLIVYFARAQPPKESSEEARLRAEK